MTHAEQEICLKEQQWREVHEFISGTSEYRHNLDKKLDNNRNIVVLILIALVVPLFIALINLGEIKKQVEINTKRLNALEEIHPRR